MKKLIVILIIQLLILSSCTEEVDTLSIEDQATYWGCWTEATGKNGVYDVKLSGNSFEFHNITIGNDCGSQLVASFDIGFFRNDTLILDNGQYEFWCYLKGDTLLYSANLQAITPTIEKLIKI